MKNPWTFAENIENSKVLEAFFFSTTAIIITWAIWAMTHPEATNLVNLFLFHPCPKKTLDIWSLVRSQTLDVVEDYSNLRLKMVLDINRWTFLKSGFIRWGHNISQHYSIL